MTKQETVKEIKMLLSELQDACETLAIPENIDKKYYFETKIRSKDLIEVIKSKLDYLIYITK